MAKVRDSPKLARRMMTRMTSPGQARRRRRQQQEEAIYIVSVNVVHSSGHSNNNNTNNRRDAWWVATFNLIVTALKLKLFLF